MPQKHNHRNWLTIFQHNLTLPLGGVSVLLLMVYPHFANIASWIDIGFVSMYTLVMLLITLRFNLISERSKVLPFLTLISLATIAQTKLLYSDFILGLGLIFTYIPLFNSYKQSDSRYLSFWIFVTLGMMIWIEPLLVILIPAYLYAMIIQFKSLNYYSFRTAILGLLLPFWILFTYYIWIEQLPLFLSFFKEGFSWQLKLLTTLHLPQQILAYYVAFIAIVSLVHFYFTLFQNNLQIRLYYHFFSFLTIIFLCLLCFFAQQYTHFLMLLLGSSLPLLARQFYFSKKRVASIYCFLILFLFLGLFICFRWIHS